MSEEKGMKMPNLPLPIIKNETVLVFLRDYPPKSPEQEIWNQMKIDLKRDGKPTKLKSRWPAKTKTNKPRVSVVGGKLLSLHCSIFSSNNEFVTEPIVIEVEVQNPLSIALSFSKVQLIGNHSPPPNSQQDVNENQETFRMIPFDCLLAPDETKKV